MIEGLKNPRDERCTPSGWAFVGFCEQGRGSKRREVMVPIGVFDSYASGTSEEAEWMRTTSGSTRTESEQIYDDID